MYITIHHLVASIFFFAHKKNVKSVRRFGGSGRSANTLSTQDCAINFWKTWHRFLLEWNRRQNGTPIGECTALSHTTNTLDIYSKKCQRLRSDSEQKSIKEKHICWDEDWYLAKGKNQKSLWHCSPMKASWFCTCLCMWWYVSVSLWIVLFGWLGWGYNGVNSARIKRDSHFSCFPNKSVMFSDFSLIFLIFPILQLGPFIETCCFKWDINIALLTAVS